MGNAHTRNRQEVVPLVQSIYKDVRSMVRVSNGYSEEFSVGVGVHQGSVRSPLLFISSLHYIGSIQGVLHRLSSVESMGELLVKLKTWKSEPAGEH